MLEKDIYKKMFNGKSNNANSNENIDADDLKMDEKNSLPQSKDLIMKKLKLELPICN